MLCSYVIAAKQESWGYQKSVLKLEIEVVRTRKECLAKIKPLEDETARLNSELSKTVKNASRMIKEREDALAKLLNEIDTLETNWNKNNPITMELWETVDKVRYLELMCECLFHTNKMSRPILYIVVCIAYNSFYSGCSLGDSMYCLACSSTIFPVFGFNKFLKHYNLKAVHV